MEFITICIIVYSFNFQHCHSSGWQCFCRRNKKHMKTGSLIIILSIILLVSCTKQGNNVFLSDIKPVSGELVNVDCLIGKPYRLVFHDTLLFICDPFDSKTLTVLDVRNNRCIDRVLQTGSGPGEVSGSLRFSLSSIHKKLYVFQINTSVNIQLTN